MSKAGSRYQRRIDFAAEDSLSKIVRWIPEECSVLDVGIGCGTLGKYLSQDQHCTVDGIDNDRDALDKGRAFYRQLFWADLDFTEPAEFLRARRYDRIVCADILEHLRFPEPCLKKFTGFLAEGGKILLSVPNVSYFGLIAELAAGKFEYRELGLLDRTHLRFFTWQSLNDLISAAGLVIERVDQVILPIESSEFAAIKPEQYLNMDSVLRNPHALTYQFIVEAAIANDSTVRAVETTTNSTRLNGDERQSEVTAASGHLLA